MDQHRVIIFLCPYIISDGLGGGVESISACLIKHFLQIKVKCIFLCRQRTESVWHPMCAGAEIYYFSDYQNVSDLISELSCKYPNAILWNRGGRMWDYHILCCKLTPWRNIISVHGDFLSLINLFHFRLMIFTKPWQKYLRWALFPVLAVRCWRQYWNMYVNWAEQCDKIVFLTQLQRETFSKKFPRFAHKSMVIPNPVRYIPCDENCLKTKEKIVLTVSRLEYYSKRIDYLLRVWKTVQTQFPDWQLCIVGGAVNSDDVLQLAEEKRLKSLAQKMGLERIIWTGAQKEPNVYYSKAAVFALTSRTEAFANVLLEAQCFGCPEIAFNSFPAASQLIADGENGCLVTPFNIREYAEKLADLMSDEQLRNQMGKSALQKVKQYMPEKIRRKWLNLFDSLLQSKGQ